MTMSIVRRAGVVALALVLATPTLALAADAPGAPKKSILEPDLINSAVTVVVFLSLLAILYKFAWGPITKGLDAREEAQRKALDDARQAREEAATMRVQFEAEKTKAMAEIRALMDEARRDADVLRVKEREAGQRDAAAELERAQRAIATQKDQMLQELNQHAVQLAAMISSKAIRRKLNADDHASLIDESLADLKAGVGRG